MPAFADRMDELAEQVGHGILRGQTEYDQVYAYNQEEGGWINFLGDRGPKKMTRGRPKFLATAINGAANSACQNLAEHVLDDEPGSLVRAMADNMERVCSKASDLAPIEFGDLRESDHPTVIDDGTIVYDRPPPVARLSREELDAKSRLKSPHTGGTGERSYLPKTSARHGTVHPDNGGPVLDKPSPLVDKRSERPHPPSDLTKHFQDRGPRFRQTTHKPISAPIQELLDEMIERQARKGRHPRGPGVFEMGDL